MFTVYSVCEIGSSNLFEINVDEFNGTVSYCCSASHTIIKYVHVMVMEVVQPKL